METWIMPLPLVRACFAHTPQTFTSIIIEPVLSNFKTITIGTGDSQLLLGVALHESGGFRYRKQVGGPALGFFQMEPATHDDIWTNFLAFNAALANEVKKFLVFAKEPSADELVKNDNYAAAMCRVQFRRFKVSAQMDDISGHAELWKKYYNTTAGSGTVEKYLADWERFGGGKVKFSRACFV